MDYDLLIRNGRVVDGSGLPGFTADVGIRDGRVAAIGRLKGGAARTINADGLVVAPGFIDHHTHLDAQMLWDPYGTSEPQHGVTSVIMGNCGLTLAPTRETDQDHEALVSCFLRVEAVPRAALAAGVPWGWRTYGDYLDRFQGRIGINVGGLVGHMAIRTHVLGEDATEREATADEILQMRALVGDSLRGGALGFSTNRNPRHMRDDGKPVPSRLATDAEVFGIAETLGELNCGVVETVGLQKPEQVAWHGEIARRTRHPVLWQSVQPRWTEPTRHEEQLAALAEEFARGHRTYALANSIPLIRYFTLADTQVFDEMPTWKNITFLPPEIRRQAYADPETRTKLQAEWNEPRLLNFHRRWDVLQIIKVVRPENERFVGRSVAEMAAMRGQDPLNAFLDLSLEEDMQTTFKSSNSRDDSEAMGAILRSPYILIGTSDAGAHVQYGVDFGYSTTLLSLWVRERGIISLEEAVHKLTFQVASIYSLRERGLLRPGYAADVTIFDPTTVRACEPEWAQDYPADTRRLIQRSEGVHYTIVNGTVIYENDRLNGDLPGQVLRGSAYAGASATAGSSAAWA